MYRWSYAYVAAVPLFLMIALGAGCWKKPETLPQSPGAPTRLSDEPVILAGGSVILTGPPTSSYVEDSKTRSIVYTHKPATPPVRIIIGLGDVTPEHPAETRFEFPIRINNPDQVQEVAAVHYQNGGDRPDLTVTTSRGMVTFTTDPNGPMFKKLIKHYLFVVKGKHLARVVIRNAKLPTSQPQPPCGPSGADVECSLETRDQYNPTINFCFSKNCRIE